MYDMDDDFGMTAAAFGAGYALLRHGQDRQADRIAGQLNAHADRLAHELRLPNDDDRLLIHAPEEDLKPAVNHQDYTTSVSEAWEDYVGQGPLKRQVQVAIQSAAMRKDRLPHTLLASGYPGVGKTTMARLIAKTMGVKLIEVVPPFKIESLVEAARQLGDGDILFIDEIHKLTDGVGARGAEMLLKVLEDHVAYLPDGSVVRLNDITIIGATTDRDKLPETVVDRFKVKPYFQAYTDADLVEITVSFAYRHDAEHCIEGDRGLDLTIAIADACRRTPRVIEELVLAMRDLSLVEGRLPTVEELLSHVEIEADGLTRTHVHYLSSMYQYFARVNGEGNLEYIAGEAAMQQILRETKQGIGRIERFLVERGLVDRTPRGRRLTERGIRRAEDLIDAGKGVSDV